MATTQFELLLLLLMLAMVGRVAASICDNPLRINNINTSWQSSESNGGCFASRNESELKTLMNDIYLKGSYFHSADSSHASGGFHWFALQLQQQLELVGVTVIGKDFSKDIYVDHVAEAVRSNNIEIWTSPAVINFGTEHCQLTNFIDIFNQHKSKFQLCGVTNNITAQNRNSTASCIASTKTLLLRKYVMDITNTQFSYMQFSDLVLHGAPLFSTFKRPLRINNIKTSWQSSQSQSGCFATRSESALKKLMNDNTMKSSYFHSADLSFASGGFHWFAVQFQQNLALINVTVIGKDLSERNAAEAARSNNIEIWTSPDDINFGTEHCQLTNFNEIFNQHECKFQLCGVTTITAQNRYSTASCIASTKTLLLRKDVTDITDATSAYMQFSDLVLYTAPLIASVTPVSAELMENQSLSINCLSQCSREFTWFICQPDGKCHRSSNLRINKVTSKSAGNYWCELHDVQRNTSHRSESVNVTVYGKTLLKVKEPIATAHTTAASAVDESVEREQKLNTNSPTDMEPIDTANSTAASAVQDSA